VNNLTTGTGVPLLYMHPVALSDLRPPVCRKTRPTQRQTRQHYRVHVLDATTVTGNGLGNTLTGNAGLDLFYGALALDTYDWDPATETFVSV
jgi:hypothetical protein